MNCEIYNKINGRKYSYSNGIDMIKIFPTGEKTLMVKSNGIFIGLMKYPSQYPIGIVKIKKDNVFLIIEFKKHHLSITRYEGKQGYELIYFQYHIIRSLQ